MFKPFPRPASPSPTSRTLPRQAAPFPGQPPPPYVGLLLPPLLSDSVSLLLPLPPSASSLPSATSGCLPPAATLPRPATTLPPASLTLPRQAATLPPASRTLPRQAAILPLASRTLPRPAAPFPDQPIPPSVGLPSLCRLLSEFVSLLLLLLLPLSASSLPSDIFTFG